MPDNAPCKIGACRGTMRLVGPHLVKKILKITNQETGREAFFNPAQIVSLEQAGEMVDIELSTNRTVRVKGQVKDVVAAAFKEKTDG